MPTPLASPAALPKDDWTTFAHDQQRTGYEQADTGITAVNVSQLHERWTHSVPGGETASPLVSNGSVYLYSNDGIVRSLNATNGTLQWQTQVANDGRMTPALDNGMLFVGAYDGGENFFALNAQSGQKLWGATLPGWVRAEPVIANGVVYEGSAGGDIPFCSQGGVFAMNETTGAQMWKWLVDPVPNDGGSVWSPLSYDGHNIVFGTGNTCNQLANTGDAVVSLTPAGQMAWEWDQLGGDSRTDNDSGGGALVVGSDVYIMNKNAYIYKLSDTSGTTLWHEYMGSYMGYGSIGTPTTDGNVIIASVGAYDNDDVNPTPGGAIEGLRPDGSVIWSIHTQHPVPGYVAITKGVAFADLDNKVVALEPSSGKILWSFTAGANFYASPVVVPSGVYAVDSAGDVYAFGLH